MDTLVARYTRSPFENEGFSSEEQQDYTDALPTLSLKFALPPIARVSHLRRSIS
jgi:20S proteasome subunit beta 5